MALLPQGAQVSRFPGGSSPRCGPFFSEASGGRPGGALEAFRRLAIYSPETNAGLEPFSVASDVPMSCLLIGQIPFFYDALRQVLMWNSEHVSAPWRLSHWLPAYRGVELVNVVRGKRPSSGPLCSPAEFAKT